MRTNSDTATTSCTVIHNEQLFRLFSAIHSQIHQMKGAGSQVKNTENSISVEFYDKIFNRELEQQQITGVYTITITYKEVENGKQ